MSSSHPKHRLIQVYCDGACSPNPGIGGWGAVLIEPALNNFRREYSGAELDSTNNRMELTAALEGLRRLKRPCSVEVYTDSKYLVNAFTQGWLNNWVANGWRTAAKKAVLNADLWCRLEEVARPHSIKWIWVKGHAGHSENERADALAVAARIALAESI